VRNWKGLEGNVQITILWCFLLRKDSQCLTQAQPSVFNAYFASLYTLIIVPGFKKPIKVLECGKNKKS
jgi:hypothetical protein